MYGEDYEDRDERMEFRSALRVGKRIYPCPACGKKKALTAADKSLGYQCDSCADRAEGRYVGGDY